MLPNLDPESILDQIRGAGYRAGFYPDDYEPIPDTPGTSDWVVWVEGYFEGCEARHAFVKRWGKAGVVNLNPLRVGRPGGGKRQAVSGDARGHRGTYRTS